MSGDSKFEGTQKEWDALVKKNNDNALEKQDTFLERLIAEEKELREKINELNRTLSTKNIAKLAGEYQFSLLNLQHGAMLTYRRVLIMRIEAATKNERSNVS